MKKTLFLTFALMAATSLSFAEGADASNGKWFMQIQGGISLPINTGSSFGSSIVSYNFDFYSLGCGGEVQVGYALSKDFSLSLEGGYESYPLTTSETSLLGFFNILLASNGLSAISANLNHIPLELVAQYNISTGGPVTPYILLGAGVAFDSISYSNVPAEAATLFSNITNTNFELDPGLGLAFAASDNVNIFIQGKLAMDFAPNTPDNVNMRPGTAETFGLNIESGFTKGVCPIMIIPIQAGVNFAFQ